MWKEPEAPHTVENLSKTTVLHLVRIELKKWGNPEQQRRWRRDLR